jgi:hypothetical protein
MSVLPDIEWCRDERCAIEALHPAHEIEVPRRRGRPCGAIKGEPRRSKRSRAGWRNAPRDSTCPVCRGRGWFKSRAAGCPACFGRGRLTVGMRYVWEKYRERVA